MQRSPTAAALSTSFLLNHAPPPEKPQAKNALITRFRESYSSVSTRRESKRLKKSSSNWLNYSQGKIPFLCFPFCQIIQKQKLFELAWQSAF